MNKARLQISLDDKDDEETKNTEETKSSEEDDLNEREPSKHEEPEDEIIDPTKMSPDTMKEVQAKKAEVE